MNIGRWIGVTPGALLVTGCNTSTTQDGKGGSSLSTGQAPMRAFAQVRTTTQDGEVRVQGERGPEAFSLNDANTADDEIVRFMQDHGGLSGLADLFMTRSPDELRTLFAPYGIGVDDRGESVPDARLIPQQWLDLEQCDQYFPTQHRLYWILVRGTWIFLDGSGRPWAAAKYLPPMLPAPREEDCQATVGHWGTGPYASYDGGHLVGSQLGGWGGRANLIPQEMNFNRGTWRVLESRAARCRRVPAGSMLYWTTAIYPDRISLTPTALQLKINIINPRSGVRLTSIDSGFRNEPRGGPNGVQALNTVVAALAGSGCN